MEDTDYIYQIPKGEFDIAKIATILCGNDLSEKKLNVELSTIVYQFFLNKARHFSDLADREECTTTKLLLYDKSERYFNISEKLKNTKYKKNIIYEYKCLTNA